jgi:hypothetical protein
LQPHQATVLASVISTFFGPKPVPLCEPSQNGWPFDFPHAHHQYVPGSTFWTKGNLCAIVGSIMRQQYSNPAKMQIVPTAVSI